MKFAPKQAISLSAQLQSELTQPCDVLRLVRVNNFLRRILPSQKGATAELTCPTTGRKRDGQFRFFIGSDNCQFDRLLSYLAEKA
ncbi:MAG: hypothetical protein IMHGJWDQ_001042 [Candidatus Fervidibacter sp.]